MHGPLSRGQKTEVAPLLHPGCERLSIQILRLGFHAGDRSLKSDCGKDRIAALTQRPVEFPQLCLQMIRRIQKIERPTTSTTSIEGVSGELFPAPLPCCSRYQLCVTQR